MRLHIIPARVKRFSFFASLLVLLFGHPAHAQRESNKETVVSTYYGAAYILTVDDNGNIVSVREPDRLTGIHLGSNGIALGDFDNDGIVDHLIGGRSEAYGLGCVEFHKGLETAGCFELGEVILSRDWGACFFVMDFAVADYDHDGNLDFAVNHCYRKIYVFFGNGDGTFEQGAAFDLPFQAVAIDAEDLDGDGNADFAAVTFDTSSFNYELPVEVFLGDGAGGFSQETIVLESPYTNGYPYARSRGIALADFDDDGASDVVVNCDKSVYNGGKILSFYRGRGDGTFEESPVISGEPFFGKSSANSFLAAMDTGDFNHDGWADIIAAHGERNETVVYTGNGDGTFALSSHASVASSLSGISTLPFETFNTPPSADPGGPYGCVAEEVWLDVDPDTFNKKASGKWVTAYLEADRQSKCRVTLDGTGSEDPEGDSLTYLWTVTDETDNEWVFEGPQPTADLSPGRYTVALVVNDGEVDSTVSSTTIDVSRVDMSRLAAEEVFLNGVPGGRSRNNEGSLVVEFDRKQVGETLEVGRNVRVFLTGRASGVDVIRVIDSSEPDALQKGHHLGRSK